MALRHSPLVVTNGLVLYLDAGNTKSYPGSGTTWTDISRNGNNGTLTNGPTFDTANGGSIVFDGADDYIGTSTNVNTVGLTTTSGATMILMLNITLLGRWTGASNFTANLGNDVDFGWDIDPTNVVRIWKNGNAGSAPNITPYSANWTMYTLVSDLTGMKFYTNSTLQTTNTTLTGSISNGATNRYLRLMDHWDNPVQGKLAITQIYNRALSQTEITQNFNALRTRFRI